MKLREAIAIVLVVFALIFVTGIKGEEGSKVPEVDNCPPTLEELREG